MYRYHKGLIRIHYKKKPHSEMRKKCLDITRVSFAYVIKKTSFRNEEKKCTHTVSYFILHSYFIHTSFILYLVLSVPSGTSNPDANERSGSTSKLSTRPTRSGRERTINLKYLGKFSLLT